MYLVFGLLFFPNLRNFLSRKLHRIVSVVACDGYQSKFEALYEIDGGARTVPNLAPNAFLVVLFRVPCAVVAPGVQPKKQAREKKPTLAIWDVHVNGRWGDGAIANILNLCQAK